MTNTKIEWTGPGGATWNPVTGCYHDCLYCYARGQARRFAGRWFENACNFNSYTGAHMNDRNMVLIPDDDAQHLYDPDCSEDGGVYMVQNRPRFILDAPLKYRTKAGKFVSAPYPFGFCPTFYRYRLDVPQHWRKPRNIFVGDMCDLFGAWVPPEWIEDVFEACQAAPQHNYLFLTKNPKRYAQLAKAGKLPAEDNFWFGVSATNWLSYGKAVDVLLEIEAPFNSFLSYEPAIEPLYVPDAILGKPSALITQSIATFKWVVTGALTGPGAKRQQTKGAWIEDVCRAAEWRRVPVFMKDSLIPIMGKDGMRREWPPGLVKW